jgi:glyoxylase-like metal-dependent hydrolase (beta-lactamase superfamily II)
MPKILNELFVNITIGRKSRIKTIEITAGIHKIDRVRGANCYLVVSGNEMLLVDTGMPHNGSRIIDYIKRIGGNPSNLKLIVQTHADLDHIGSAAELKQMTGAKLAIHSEDSPILSGKIGMKIVRGPLGLLFKLMYPLVRFHPIKPDIILNDDMDIVGFKVVHIPGHTRGSICLYRPGKIIFVGNKYLIASRASRNS